MGYRNDVLLAIAFKTKEDRDEVWAVYCMDKRVQEHSIAGAWKNHDDEEAGAYCLWWEADYVKWYENYEDVQGYEHLQAVAQQFADNRDMQYAWVKYRLGEASADIEEEHMENDDSQALQEYLCDMCGVSRKIEHSFN